MNRIERMVGASILASSNVNKVLLLFGTRRVGKTYLVRMMLEKYAGRYILLNGEDLTVQELFRNRSVAHYKSISGEADLLVIDEAQAIPDIGKALKLMIDSQPDLTILATGSSSLDLSNASGEPLTGRQISFFLYPVAQLELNQHPIEARQHLDERLIFGSYPEVFQIARQEDKALYLQQLVQSYLLKDILSFSGIRHSDKIYALLRLVAFQTGSEVSYQELSNQLGISKITVENYLDLLSKVFILFKLPAYSTNKRNEIAKSAKWYFYDNGIRNAVVSDFRLPSMRNDMGALWESYIISERIKKLSYSRSLAQFYFWRNYQQQEIDLVEYENGVLRAFEVKWSPAKKLKIPSSFRAAYPDTSVEVIHKDNYLDFIL
jgi:predicted AAA+ superfamily ATPase